MGRAKRSREERTERWRNLGFIGHDKLTISTSGKISIPIASFQATLFSRTEVTPR